MVLTYPDYLSISFTKLTKQSVENGMKKLINKNTTYNRVVKITGNVAPIFVRKCSKPIHRVANINPTDTEYITVIVPINKDFIEIYLLPFPFQIPRQKQDFDLVAYA